MLSSTPASLSPAALRTFERQPKLTVEIIQLESTPIHVVPIDPAEVFYDEWHSEDGFTYFGTRHRLSLLKHGVVRWVWPGKGVVIQEAQWEQGAK